MNHKNGSNETAVSIIIGRLYIVYHLSIIYVLIYETHDSYIWPLYEPYIPPLYFIAHCPNNNCNKIMGVFQQLRGY